MNSKDETNSEHYETTSFILSTTESEQGQAENQLEIQVTQPIISLPERPAFNQEAFNENYQLIEPQKQGWKEKFKKLSQNGCPTKQFWWEFAKARFPILVWLPKYQWKNHFFSDVIAGITTSILHVSLGMAFAALSFMPPITGLYVAFFSNILYTFVGSAHHLALCGTALISLMIGEVVQRVLHPVPPSSPFGPSLPVLKNSTRLMPEFSALSLSSVDNTAQIQDDQINAISVATSVTLVAGLIHVTTGTMRLGGLAVYLSDTMLSGFLTGTACHVFTSQFATFFGVTIPRINSPLKVFKTIIAVCAKLPTANVATIITSLTTLLILALCKYFGSRCLKIISFPLPVELFVILLGSLVSYYLDFENFYKVSIVGYIPTGLPAPAIPHLTIIPSIMLDSIIIGIVSYTITLSFGLVYAKKYGYKINSNQELLALGIVNICGAFFQCVPACVGMSRTMAQEAAGCRTLMTNFVGAILVLFAILFFGPMFRCLPSCILAAIVMVALRGMFAQVTTLRKAWSISILEASLWIVAFAAVTIIDVGLGLGIGLIYSLIVIVVRTQRPYVCLLGKIPRTDMYLDINKYQVAEEIPGIKIFHFSSFLYFVNKEYFKTELYRLVGVDPILSDTQENLPPFWTRAPLQGEDLLLIYPKLKSSPKYGSFEDGSSNGHEEIPATRSGCNNSTNILLHHIIIDASGWNYIDLPGIEALAQVVEEYQKKNITVFIAGCQVHVSGKLVTTEFYRHNKHLIFPSIHDAMAYAEMEGALHNTSS